MKLVYTDISNDMTLHLAQEAQAYAQEGKRVFYIAPNSLSFEKERKVLSHLPSQASFQITVTRFAQMARYFVLDKEEKVESIDDMGLTMIFYRILSQLEDQELRVYGRLKKDTAFIQQLVDLYKELKTANLSLLDLQTLETEKIQDLTKIFAGVTSLLSDYQIENQSKLALLASYIQTGQLDQELADTVVVIDGFTRFSAEEDYLVHLLSQKCAQIVIGTYASQKAYRSNFIYGNVYQAPVEFLRNLTTQYGVKPSYISGEKSLESPFSDLTRNWESLYDFSQQEDTANFSGSSAVQMWSSRNQKEEVEWVARRIRQLLAEGVRYKDIVVLLGDVDSYKIQVETLFDKFDIPYYFGKAESMAHHPLVHFIDSLERIKRYNYRAEDVLNFLKSGLFGDFSQEEVDRFAHYVRFSDRKGVDQFDKEFRINPAGKYNLEDLNRIRQSVMWSLQNLLSLQEQPGHFLLLGLQELLKEGQVPQNMASLAQGASESEKEKHQQVWTVFSQLLQQLNQIFAEEVMEIGELLSLLRSGMLAAEYRTVPATVDVVTIKSYDLIEPHTSPYVFAMGMTKGYFPKIAQNKSLLTDEERQLINESTPEFSSFEIASKENSKKGHFTALSLFQSAQKQLVLSFPQLLNETEDEMSVYLKDLLSLGVAVVDKSVQRFEAHSGSIGHYKDLLGTVLALHRSEFDQEWTKEEQTFWSVAARYVTKRLDAQGIDLREFIDSVKTSPVSQEALLLRFPPDQDLPLSVSALTTFYNNQYLYFLRYVLGLKELESIHPDSRQHGMYLHKIFERAMVIDGRDFDSRLEAAIYETNQSDEFAFFYEQDEEGKFSRYVLEKIARSTASVLREQKTLEIIGREKAFDTKLDEGIRIRGVIDRVDRLADGQSLGVVDYKSGATHFDIQQFYNGLHSQLVTYLETIKESYGLDLAHLFGAMYLHMQEPKLDLKSVTAVEELPARAQTELTYKGIFQDQHKGFLADGRYHLANSLYNEGELETLLDYNKKLFEEAVTSIRTGHFLINPYTKDGKSVEGRQEKSITHFEADRHMPHARRLVTGPSRGKKAEFIERMNQDLGKGGKNGNESISE